MARGKYAARAAKRREVQDVELELDQTSRALRQTQSELETCRARLADESQRVQRLRDRLDAGIEAESAPLVASLQQQVDALRSQRDEADAKAAKIAKHWEAQTDRLFHYILAVDPAKPTRTEAFGIMIFLQTGEDSAGVRRPDLVYKDETLDQVRNNIERRKRWAQGAAAVVK